MTKFALSLREKHRAILQTKPDYDILVNGEKRGDLYFNMTGYRGGLPMLSGSTMDLGEVGLSTWKKEIAVLNKEARTAIKQAEAATEFVISISPALDGRDIIVELGEKGAKEGSADNRLAFCSRNSYERLKSIFDLIPASLLCLEEGRFPPVGVRDPSHGRHVLKALDTSDPERVAVAVGHLPDLEEGRYITFEGDLTGQEIVENAQSVLIIKRESFDWLSQTQGSSIFPASMLPHGGFHSEMKDINWRIPYKEKPIVYLPEGMEALFDICQECAIPAQYGNAPDLSNTDQSTQNRGFQP